MSEHEDHEDGYTGAATLITDGTEVEVRLELRGHFQPIDGYYRWYGRISANEQVDALAGGKKRKVTVRTPDGTADGEISDPDPWGRYRVMGTSTPPFFVPKSLNEIEAISH